jgi:hypothetical protein
MLFSGIHRKKSNLRHSQILGYQRAFLLNLHYYTLGIHISRFRFQEL